MAKLVVYKVRWRPNSLLKSLVINGKIAVKIQRHLSVDHVVFLNIGY